jgi:hypothetical protein
VAFDWQVYAADQRYYDIGFAGTDDGRVIKFVNKGRSKIEPLTLEDIQVGEIWEHLLGTCTFGGKK